MLPTNDDIRKFLVSEYGEKKGNDIVLFPAYADAFEGVTLDGRVIYNMSRACASRAIDKHITFPEAMTEITDELKRLCSATGDKSPVINTGSPFEKI